MGRLQEQATREADHMNRGGQGMRVERACHKRAGSSPRDQDEAVVVAGGVAVANMGLGPASGRLSTCNSRTT